MPSAILTKYLGPTPHRGSRIIAMQDNRSIILSCDSSKNFLENCKQAVGAICRKNGWNGKLIGGHTKEGMVWVFVGSYKLTVK